MIGLVLLVSTHFALCSLLLFSGPDVHPCRGAEADSHGLTVQADH